MKTHNFKGFLYQRNGLNAVFKIIFHSDDNSHPHLTNICMKRIHQTKSDAEIYILYVQESLAYPLVSFVAEFGGTLGLFLGFSFMRLVFI